MNFVTTGFLSLFAFVLAFQARRGGIDEPFAWESREFLRKLCIGKVVAAKFKLLIIYVICLVIHYLLYIHSSVFFFF